VALCELFLVNNTWRLPSISLRLEGHQVCEADVARLSPLIHDHINMLGWYSFAMPETVAWVEL
jgi:hypothetical protein